jgi:ABC-2 type transport system permease protein
MIWTIATRELKNLFLSPLAWAVLAILQTILAYLFIDRLNEVLQAGAQLLAVDNAPGITELIVPPFFLNVAIVMLLVTPLLTMRLIAEERRNRTLPLLFSAPVSMTEIVLGKYLGALLFLWLLLALVTLMPLSLMLGGQLDLGLLVAAVLGLALLFAVFAAVGVFMSSVTQYAAIAAVGSLGLLLFFWVIDLSGQGATQTSIAAYLSLVNHYLPFLQGRLHTDAVVYYVLFVVTFLVLTIRRLDADRLGG